MKLFVLRSDSPNVSLGPLWALLDELGISYEDCPIGETEKFEETPMGKGKFYPSHIVIVPESGPAEAWWYYYALGYIQGTERPERLCIYYSADINSKPVLPPGVTESHSFRELKSYVTAEAENFQKKGKRKAAEKRIIEAGLAVSFDSFGECIKDGFYEGVEWFLDAGFSANSVNRRGVPVLNLAVRNERFEIFDLLLRKGADIDAVSGDNGNTPLMEAVVIRDERFIEELLNRGGDLNIQNKNGQTALIIAVGNGYAEIVRELLRKEIDLSIADNLGMTARKYAELFHHSQILALLDPGLVS